MKITAPIILATLTAVVLVSPPRARAAATAPSIVERAPHSRVWQWTTEEDWPGGTPVSKLHRVVELATGICYQKDGQGPWLDSQEIIEILPTGDGIARQGQHRVLFPGNIREGVVELVSPSGEIFRSRPLGLAYFDAASGKSLLFADLQSSVGKLVQPNQVLYPGALADAQVDADLRLTYHIGSFEADVVLRSRPPSPADWGLDPATTRIQVWHEMFEAPAGTKESLTLRREDDPAKRAAMVEPDFLDQDLRFASVHIGQGQAFALDPDPSHLAPQTSDLPEGVFVGKEWTSIPDPETGKLRTFLVESVEYESLKPLLDTLPVHGASLSATNNTATTASVKRKPANSRAGLIAALPKTTSSDLLARSVKDATRKPPSRIQHPASSIQTPRPSDLALRDSSRRPGVVIDYTEIIGSLTNYVFRSDTTYYLRSLVYLYGSNNVLEGGCVLKITNGLSSRICVYGSLQCQTTNYFPALFTAKDDATVGELIPGSSPTPTNYYYGDQVLYLSASGTDWDFHDLCFRYPQRAITVGPSGGRSLLLRNVQMGQGLRLLTINASPFTNRMQNVLFYNCAGGCVYGGGNTNSPSYAEHLTWRNVGSVFYGGTTNFFVTNSLLVNVTNGMGTFIGGYNGTNSDPGDVFQTVGFGSNYLANNSPYRNAGTTNISPSLLTALKTMTTYPPVPLAASITTDTILSPQAGRDTDTPDLGAHYAPLDYLACGVTVASNVTVLATNGVAIGIDYSTNSWGFILNSARFLSEGSPTLLNRLVRAHTVQEQSGGNPFSRACFYDGSSLNASNELRLRHTEFTQLADDGYMLYTGQQFRDLEWTHSRIYNPSLVIDTSGGNLLACGVTNTLWWRGGGMFGLTSSSSNVTVHLRNNLYRLFSLHFIGGTTNWTVRDNLFDSLAYLGDHTSPVENRCNGSYLTDTANFTLGSSNVFLTDCSYQPGPLGSYYYPTNAPGAGVTNLFNLINAGSRTADLAGLYHYTTTTNQVKETNSIVDIGMHYVAVGADGQPLDYDSDGIPDYFEDRNGNGALDSAETNWQQYNSQNGLTGSPGLKVFTPLK